MKRIYIISALLACSGCAFAAQNFNYEQNTPTPTYQPAYYSSDNYKLNNNTLKGSVVTVPAGQTFKAVMASPITSETATVGQNVTMFLGSDFYYNNARIAPAGSTINGSVIEVNKAKHGSLNGKLTLRFTQIITPTGLNIPISAIHLKRRYPI